MQFRELQLRMNICIFLTSMIGFLSPWNIASADQDSTSHSFIRYIPWASSSVFLGISFSAQAKEYWMESSPFHVMDWQTEYDDALMADKLGHAMISYSMARSISGVFEQCGYDRKTSTWLGSGISLLHQSIVEIHDGYSNGAPYLGFSRGDAIANIIGAGFPILQEYVPELDFIRMKFSFLPSESFKRNAGKSLFNDYESTYHWLSFNITGMIGKKHVGPWAEYVNIALGHSVNGINRYGSGNHEFYISLDFNAEALPFDDGWGLTLKRMLNSVKLPMPCIKVYPDVVWYGIRI